MTEKRNSKTRPRPEAQPMAQSHWAVSKYLGEMKFQKVLFGVDEADVLRKMEKLCELYEFALEAERNRADAAQQKLDQIYARARAIQTSRKEGPKGGGQL